jgi:molybdopterin-containing oxidoreductase family membrane subunit
MAGYVAERIKFSEFATSTRYWPALAALALTIVAGLGSAWVMEHNGHIVSGMDNRVVWGLPHVFAILLIVAASGALNVASIASVFDGALYKPLARLSALMAIGLLVGGLSVLVLDLGRPDRLIVAMTTYNFKSIFAWNVFLYTGFLVITAAYLFVMMSRGMEALTKPAGVLAFVWRLALTTGTGSIFGWLVARDTYNSAIMAPLFIALSLAVGTAVFMLALTWLMRADSRVLDDVIVRRLGRLLALFVAATLYFVAIKHLTALYIAQRVPAERFILGTGGLYSTMFWGGGVLAGGLLPIALVYGQGTRKAAIMASALVVVGAIAHLYVIIIGGQAFPQTVFPGFDVTSAIGDGAVADYRPRLPEVLLGLGGSALGLAIVLLGSRVLPILPDQVTAPAASRPLTSGPGAPVATTVKAKPASAS